MVGEQIRTGEAETALSAPQLLGESFCPPGGDSSHMLLRVRLGLAWSRVLGCPIKPPPFFDFLLGIVPRRGEGAIRVRGCHLVGLLRDLRFTLGLCSLGTPFGGLLQARCGDRGLRLALLCWILVINLTR